ncbi:MAG: Gfo/Idh/MocA family protein [Phycisphaerales bacterium JB052]
MSRGVRVGIVGYGFMGRTHARAYQAAARDGYPCTLSAIADNTLRSLDEADDSSGNLETDAHPVDFNGVTLHRTAEGLLADSTIDAVSICTHTDTHVDLAIQALRAGKHVLVEKPIAIDPAQVQRLADEASMHALVCMPAMCMRYWPAWVKLHEMIKGERYGRVRSAEFHRMGSRPGWAEDFYADEARSGGALYDLHIHDTDFIVHCFGLPRSVSTSGDGLHLSTIYHYDLEQGQHPVHVLAQGAWDHQASVGFRMRCTVVCERATLDFDISREDQLVVHRGDESKAVDVGMLSGYDGEVRAMLDAIAGQPKAMRASMSDAAQTARVLDTERVSMQNGQTVTIEC